MDVELQRQKVPTAFWKENLFDNYMKDWETKKDNIKMEIVFENGRCMELCQNCIQQWC
jgi:hypothetical protein